MATTSYLIKSILHKSLAEGVYRDITTKKSNYYYMLGKTIPWNTDDDPPYPIDSYAYERATRTEAITYKSINSSDVSFVVDRIDWLSNTVYDMYDDSYSGQVIGLNLKNGGSGYTSLPTVTITGGGGTGASYGAIVDTATGKIIGVQRFATGSGYTSTPTVTITGGGGINGIMTAVVEISPNNGSHILENAHFYVLTDDYNVYKCLDNNNNSLSTSKPSGTQTGPILMPDGYIWKYMYNIPIGLRNKFLTTEHMPVISALTNQFYSNGQLDAITINTRGTNYISANIIVDGDGYREIDPVYIQNLAVNQGGTGYTGSSVVTVSDPYTDASPFVGGSSVSLGQKIYNSTKDFYEVASPGTLGGIEATHRYDYVRSDSYIGVLWTANTVVALGDQRYYGANLYQVTVAGTTSGTPPTGTSNVPFSDGTATLVYVKPTPKGTAVLKYLGTTATATCTLSGNAISAINFVGSLKDIEVISAGSGYTSIPTVNITGGGGTSASAYCQMNGSSVLYVDIIDQGKGYTSDPTITFGTEWTSGGTVHLYDQIYYNGRLYTVSAVSQTNAILSSTGPSHTTGSATNGQATLTFAGTPATATCSRKFGSGYTKAPTVSVSIGTGFEYSLYTAKSNAKLVPVISNGQIDSVTVVDGGVGYTTAAITVNSTSGYGASLAANLAVGSIQSLQANNEILSVAGAIDAIKIVSGGYGYGTATVNIIGDGVDAAAEAVINPIDGSISKINITNRGSAYTFATIVINGNGFGAEARAIMPPFGGHGRNSPDELFARTLMFYTNMSNDLNQGLSINNDYRQVAIVKNPYAYGTTNRFTSLIGSGCFVVQSAINTTLFPKDSLVFINRANIWTSNTALDSGDQVYYGENLYLVTEEGTTGSTGPSHTYGNLSNGSAVLMYVGTPRRYYRIVVTSPTSVLLQSLDNDTPTVSDTLLNSNSNSFKPLAVGYPTVDKYSGQLMYIDNKAGFTPSENETVTFRTVIKF